MSKRGEGERAFVRIEPDWRDRLRRAGLRGFGDFWSLDRTWIDVPNRRGRGWSAVSEHQIASNGGRSHHVFLKRQEDYFIARRRWLVGRRILVVEREVANMDRFIRADIPCARPIAWGSAVVDGVRRGFLLTEALDGYVALSDVLARLGDDRGRSVAEWHEVVALVARAVRSMHDRRLIHSMLYPKHVLVRNDLVATGGGAPSDVAAVRFIDLESSRRAVSRRRAAINDLEKLHRQTHGPSRTDRLRFFMAWAGTRHLVRADKRLIHAIVDRTRRRRIEKRKRGTGLL